MPEVSSEDSSSKSKNAITREKSRSVELGRKEFPTWRVTGKPEVTARRGLLHRITSGWPTILELARLLAISAFVGTKPTGELITSGLPVTRAQSLRTWVERTYSTREPV